MKRGAKPTPTAVKMALGKLPKTTAQIPNVLASAPKAPVNLEGRALEEWDRIWTIGYPWISPAGDLRVVTRYCLLTAEEEEIREVILREGAITEGYNGQPRPHPLYARLASVERNLIQIEDRTGLNPVERGRMGHVEVKTRSVLDEFREKRIAHMKGVGGGD